MSIFFISGHLNLTPEEFKQYYKKDIKDEIKNGSSFIVGDCNGADKMAQEYLFNMKYDKVTVYHMLDSPRNNVGDFKTVGGFKSDNSRDTACTKNSMFDILYIRSNKEQKELLGDKYDPNRTSGTQKNLFRRHQLVGRYIHQGHYIPTAHIGRVRRH